LIIKLTVNLPFIYWLWYNLLYPKEAQITIRSKKIETDRFDRCVGVVVYSLYGRIDSTTGHVTGV